jgi:membrane-associated phospholipid phosphatase
VSGLARVTGLERSESQRDLRWLYAAAALLAVAVALAVSVTAGWLGPHSVDGRIVRSAHRLTQRDHWTLTAARAVTELGAPVIVDALAVVAAVGLLLCRRAQAAGFVAAVRLATALATTQAKVGMHRRRPAVPHPTVHVSGYSFPSGHAAGAASVYLPLALLLLLSSRRPAVSRSAVFVAGTVCVLVSISRVVLGVHYPSDVIAGVALGAALSCAGAWLFRIIPARPDATDRSRAATDMNTIG